MVKVVRLDKLQRRKFNQPSLALGIQTGEIMTDENNSTKERKKSVAEWKECERGCAYAADTL